jgi:MEDS: MEthanogen/methylotroph, DcmR Sensory domain
MPFTEVVIRGQVRSKHLVQLFDDHRSLVLSVSEFLREGIEAGDVLLVVCTPDHWNAMAFALSRSRVDVTDAIERGQVVVRDAAELLDSLMHLDSPDKRLFDAHVGALVRDLARLGKPLRIYGEMVDLLAGMDNHRAAHRLEEIWNELAERESFTLFCGYSAAHFGDPLTGPALQAICRSHSHVRSDDRDVLGSFLLNDAGLR